VYHHSILLPIILGSVYGFCSNSIVTPEGVHLDDVEILLRMGLISDDWVYEMGPAVDTIAEVIDPDVGCTSTAWLYSLVWLFHCHHVDRGESTKFLLGAQLKGLSMISDFIVRPTIRPLAMFRVHLRRGQILNLPTDPRDLIYAANSPFSYENTFAVRLSDMVDQIPPASSLDTPRPIPAYHLIAEPAWDTDVSGIMLKARELGLSVASIDIRRLYYCLPSSAGAECSCAHGRSVEEMTVSDSSWYAADFSDFLLAGVREGPITMVVVRDGVPGVDMGGVSIPGHPSKAKIQLAVCVIDAMQEEAMSIIAAGHVGHQMEGVQPVRVAFKCLKCAVESLKEYGRAHILTLVIPFGFGKAENLAIQDSAMDEQQD